MAWCGPRRSRPGWDIRHSLGAGSAGAGRAWFGDQDIDDVHNLVGQVPILDIDGGVLAVVSVSERYPSIWELLSGAGERLLIYLGLGAVLGLLASWLLSRRIKRHTRGLEVAEIAGLADHREALLHSIREGVVGVGNDGEITVLNDSAKELLDLTDGAIGRRVDDVGLDPAVADFLLSGEDGHRRRRGRHRPGDHHAHKGFGAQQAGREHRRSAHRHGDHDARQHRTGRPCRPSCRPTRASPTRCVPRPTSSPTSCTPSPVWCSSVSMTRFAIWSAP